MRVLPLSTKITILFGGTLQSIGWFFFSFGMIFAIVFAGNADFSFIHFQGDIERTTGRVTDAFETNASSNDRSIYEVHYKFQDRQERWHESFSYQTGYAPSLESQVSVEYPLGKPHYSRISGMRRELFGPVVSFVLIFPLIGFLMVVFGMRSSIKAIKLLQHGELTSGQIIDKRPTGTTINDQRVYEFTFEFKDLYGKVHETTMKTHETRRVEDEENERLLYLKSEPQNAVLLDALPGHPALEDSKRVEAVGSFRAIGALFKPFLLIVVIIGANLF